MARLYTSKTTATTITESLNDFNRSGFSNTLCLSYNKLGPEIKISPSLDFSKYCEILYARSKATDNVAPFWPNNIVTAHYYYHNLV